MTIKFARWQETECSQCNCDFQVTRTHEKEFESYDQIICDSCEMYNLGYKEGEAIHPLVMDTYVIDMIKLKKDSPALREHIQWMMESECPINDSAIMINEDYIQYPEIHEHMEENCLYKNGKVLCWFSW